VIPPKGCGGLKARLRAGLGFAAALLAGGGAADPLAKASSESRSFDARPPPAAPDYGQASSWAALPWIKGAADLAPANASPKAAEPLADVFYVHPTTYRFNGVANQALSDAATNDWTDISVVARQASIFNGCCKIYAPRYRQASSGAFYAADGEKAYALGYSDVLRAFDYYLAHYNHGRPFILAGHSQGAKDVFSLLIDRIDGAPLQRRLIAAYAIGVGVSVGEFGKTYKTVQPCRKPEDLGCVVSWNSFTRTSDASAYLTRSESRYVARFGEAGKTLLCVNPLTFDLDQPSAPADLNLGSLPGLAAPGPLPDLIPGAVGADCVDGVLRADTPTSAAFHLTILPNGALHFHDMDLYYENIRANAEARVAAYGRRPGS
jgi:hypothetical protein